MADKIGSKEMTKLAMLGGDGQNRHIDGWHGLTNEFDFSAESFEEWLGQYNHLLDITFWVAEIDNDEALVGCFGEESALEEYDDEEYCVYAPYPFNESEIKAMFNEVKAEFLEQ